MEHAADGSTPDEKKKQYGHISDKGTHNKGTPDGSKDTPD